MATSIKRLCIGTGLALSLMAVGLGLWRKAVVSKRTHLALTTIEKGINTTDFVAARAALPSIADPGMRGAMDREIRLGELKSALTTRDTGLLRLALGSDSANWINPGLREAADLELAREAMRARDDKGYQAFVEKWAAKSSNIGQWTLLEADRLLARKLPDDARELLRNAQLSGVADAQRHARLALLEAKEPWKAMGTIDEGLKADPRNADLPSFRAQIEEAAGRLDDARLDYVAAVLCAGNNPLHRDQLAGFYLRVGNLAAAAETWREAAAETHLGVYALKCWFWARVGGTRLSQPLPSCHLQGWSNLITALAATPDNVFWSASLDAELATIRGASERPEVLWLRLLEALRSADAAAIHKQLEVVFSHTAEALWPQLALRLRTHLAALAGQDPRLPLAGQNVPVPPDDAHPFVAAFANWAKRKGDAASDASMAQWLAQPTAAVGILLGSGWAGAAVMIGQGDKLVMEANGPDWFDYGYGRSLLLRDGKESARRWLAGLPRRSSAAELLLGELLLTSGAFDQGLASLQSVAAGQSPHASRAAWTLALAELGRGNPAKARQITLATPALATSSQGKEVLARCALAEGSRAETIRIYQELGEQSADAMIFLSKEAFSAGDFEQARKWTILLARRFPEQPKFRENLIAIDAAEKSKKP